MKRAMGVYLAKYGWTYAEVADRSGLSPRTIADVGRGLGPLRMDTLTKIATAGGIDVAAFLRLGDPPVAETATIPVGG